MKGLVLAVALWAHGQGGAVVGHHAWRVRHRQQVVQVALPLRSDGRRVGVSVCSVLAWHIKAMAAPWHGVAMKRVTPWTMTLTLLDTGQNLP